MFKLNLTIALRNLWKNKVSSFINVIGLAIGLAACLMLLIYVFYEWNFDKQSKNADSIYTALTNVRDNSGKIMVTFEGTTTAFAPALKEEIPEVKYISRLNYGSDRNLIANGQNSFKKLAKFADPDFLKMYDYQFIYGDPGTAMSDPNSIILTEGTAQTLFGSKDVLNKTIRFRDQFDLKITGVIKDPPANSSNQFDYLIPWSFYQTIDADAKDINWTNYSINALVSLNPGANVDVVNTKIAALLKKHDNQKYPAQFLYPLSKMHLYGKFEEGKSVGGAIEKIWLFMGLAIGILLIACINFMNMATAKSEKRAKEVGIKKTIGATRSSLILQFLTESLVLTIFSVLMAIALVELCLPAFNNLLGTDMHLPYLQGYILLWIVGIVLFTGFVAGSYPAFYLSSFNPVETLRRKTGKAKFLNIGFRQILIVGQFCFTIMLIIATLVIYKQIQYVKNRPLGIDANALVEMPQDGALKTRFNELRERLLKSGAVTSMYYSYSGLAHHDNNFSGMRWPGMKEENTVLFNKVFTTVDFIKTTGLKLTDGRDFSEKYASDSAAVLISKSAVKTMGLTDPVGKVLQVFSDKVTVIGVFEDYVWDSPYKANNPMIVNLNKKYPNVITMRLNAQRGLQENVETIERITKQLNPAYPVEVSFISSVYGDMFKQEKILGVLSNIFGALAVFISCLGLFGLVAYSAEQRTKEFGVRKVLGASVYSLMQLLSLSFIKMIAFAILIAVPLAYYGMGIWLQKFEFHTSISWWIITVAALGTLLIAFLTVSYQAYKTATSNPVDALKYE
ncbi:ABC-type transport system, involved in lipoprotein release, permease component [Pedobacter westerhofensis]|uniref:ABC-type transport system, involved in lipoprotein release, permease component n=1 Tax=Pedobacter westerhofensis TaxID=425512 RepID=A0A521E778_9SPHI|nr:ABC transporter permease [Pedobacter westerhofensis]SMO79788.1 ABC-type transport system, involved in lipoprotein release, permease component [Pedobacter westerhofensis]